MLQQNPREAVALARKLEAERLAAKNPDEVVAARLREPPAPLGQPPPPGTDTQVPRLYRRY